MSTFDYSFNKLGRIGYDITDNTERNLQNSKFSNYSLTSHFTQTQNHIQFATNQPTVNFHGHVSGKGLNGNLIDYDSLLIIKTQKERSLERLNLNQRTFLTIPYLGKGSVDPILESKLQCGENATQRKSVSTIMDKNFDVYTLYPTDKAMMERVNNPKYTIEEFASSDGDWVRGGKASRRFSEESSYHLP